MNYKSILGLTWATLLGSTVCQYQPESTKIPEAQKFGPKMIYHFDKNCSGKIDLDDFEAEFRLRTILNPRDPKTRLLPVGVQEGNYLVYRFHGGHPEHSIVIEFPFQNYCPPNLEP